MTNLSRKSISDACRITVLFTCIVVSFTIIIMNALMYEGFFIRGVNWIYNYQQSQPQRFIRVIYNIFAFIGGPTGVAIVIAIYFILVKRKLKFFVHISYFMYCTYLMALFKQSFQETRPVWYDSRIQQW